MVCSFMGRNLSGVSVGTRQPGVPSHPKRDIASSAGSPCKQAVSGYGQGAKRVRKGGKKCERSRSPGRHKDPDPTPPLRQYLSRRGQKATTRLTDPKKKATVSCLFPLETSHSQDQARGQKGVRKGSERDRKGSKRDSKNVSLDQGELVQVIVSAIRFPLCASTTSSFPRIRGSDCSQKGSIFVQRLTHSSPRPPFAVGLIDG